MSIDEKPFLLSSEPLLQERRGEKTDWTRKRSNSLKE
jgi:hypothetical protein